MKHPLETSLAYKYFVAYRLYDGKRFDEVVVPYRPHHRLNRKITKVFQDHRWPGYLLVALLLSTLALIFSGGTITVAASLMLIFAAFSWLMLQMFSSTKPTHFGMSPKGIRLYWIHWFGDKSSPYIPWESISYVRCRRARLSGNESETFIDFLSAADATTSLFTFRLEGVITGEQRKRLHNAIKQHLSNDQIDWQLHDNLNPIKIDGYTSMWLEVLATTPQRNRQDVLPTGTIMANQRYEIVGQMGAGGQGIAYLGLARPGATDTNSLPLNVVLKEFVLPYHAGLSVSKKAFDSIQQEAMLLKRLTHPRIVRMVDLFVEDQRAYMVLEHIPGESLRQIIAAKGPYSESQVCTLGIQMCEILAYLHSQSPPVLHRDFTPENLIMSVDGQLKLIDFNVAQQMHSDATRTVVGKHSFIPPEQFRGKATTQSDLYAMGASLYYLLTGKEPEPITESHPRMIDASITPELDSIIAHATTTDAAQRYHSAEEVKADLEKLLA